MRVWVKGKGKKRKNDTIKRKEKNILSLLLCSNQEVKTVSGRPAKQGNASADEGDSLVLGGGEIGEKPGKGESRAVIGETFPRGRGTDVPLTNFMRESIIVRLGGRSKGRGGKRRKKEVNILAWGDDLYFAQSCKEESVIIGYGIFQKGGELWEERKFFSFKELLQVGRRTWSSRWEGQRIESRAAIMENPYFGKKRGEGKNSEQCLSWGAEGIDERREAAFH